MHDLRQIIHWRSEDDVRLAATTGRCVHHIDAQQVGVVAEVLAYLAMSYSFISPPMNCPITVLSQSYHCPIIVLSLSYDCHTTVTSVSHRSHMTTVSCPNKLIVDVRTNQNQSNVRSLCYL